ncbi:NAD(P)/FAD-dependent oxidoreductase [Thermogemmatispora onikobensis]|uniref:NAD(P)/FAD-dependent oxidoreductase n=1 Tax=Thermogemmatispora onikobensis TaxID=732234 RepID=UPI000853E03B|nr:NAD(P)/FAD-dependent oxidoreductase [Thermogemmatispora onikobensis]
MQYAIFGGGALGLVAAYRLAQAGQSVMVFEQEEVPGGLAAGFQVAPGVWLEKFYHHLFRTDRAAIRLIKELGLGPQLVWSTPRTESLIEGQIYRLDSPTSLLAFRPLRFYERLRVGAVAAFLKLSPSWPLEGRTAAPWLRRWMGKRAYELVFEPLFVSKFGALHEQIALPWFWARFHDRTTSLGYLKGGFQQLYDRLAERITSLGGKILLGTRIEGAEPLATSGWQVRTTRGTWTVDQVISTLATRLTLRLIPALPSDYRARYEWGQAYGTHCLILALDRRLTATYWLNICDPGYPFLSIVEHTNLRPPEEYGGRHLLYLGNYRPMDDPLFQMEKAEVLTQFLPHLRRIRPDFDPSWVRESWMFRAPFAQPIVTPDYREHIPPLKTPLPGLWLANMFQVYPHDRGQNYSIALAERLVRLILEEKEASSHP